MGVGERSEALPNIKAMGEKMLCPPREPGLRPPHSPPLPPPPPQPFPTAQPNFNKSSGPQLPSEAVAASSGPRQLELGAPAQVGPHIRHPTPPSQPDPILGGQVQGKGEF